MERVSDEITIRPGRLFIAVVSVIGVLVGIVLGTAWVAEHAADIGGAVAGALSFDVTIWPACIVSAVLLAGWVTAGLMVLYQLGRTAWWVLLAGLGSLGFIIVALSTIAAEASDVEWIAAIQWGVLMLSFASALVVLVCLVLAALSLFEWTRDWVMETASE